jgi:O-antigen/teichoic acid export membrane protein
MSESETRQDDSKVFPNSFIRSGALLFGAILFWHLSNFAFNAIGARLLGPSQYGTLAAATALLYVASPFFFSVQTVASRLTTRLYSRSEWDRLHGLLRYYGKRLAAGGFLLAGAVAIGSSALARFLRISSPMPIAILGIAFGSSLITHLQRGVLQGSLRFARYAFSTVMEGAVKIVAAVSLLVLVSRDANAAVLAVVISSLLAVAVNWALLGFLPASRTTVPLSQVYRYSLVTLSSLLLLAILLSVDLLAAKRYLDPHTAGLYAAVSLS